MVVFYIVLFIVAVFILFWRNYCLKKSSILENLENRPIFITGCDSGFGHGLAVKLLELKIPVFAGCLTAEGEQKVQTESVGLPGKLKTLNIDVRNLDSVKKAYDYILENLGGQNLWGLVCNAGIFESVGPDDWTTPEDYAKHLEVNTLGVIKVCQTFRLLIKRSKGRIVIITSLAGKFPVQFGGPYVVSKFATEGYAGVIRQEAKDFGYTVHIVTPGVFQTNMTDYKAKNKLLENAWMNMSEEKRNEYGNEYFKKVMKTNESRFLSWINGGVDPVVNAYVHALTACFPKIRYTVGTDAHISTIVGLLPYWLQDTIVETIDKLCVRK